MYNFENEVTLGEVKSKHTPWAKQTGERCGVEGMKSELLRERTWDSFSGEQGWWRERQKQPFRGRRQREGKKCPVVSGPGQWWSRCVALLHRLQEMLRNNVRDVMRDRKNTAHFLPLRGGWSTMAKDQH